MANLSQCWSTFLWNMVNHLELWPTCSHADQNFFNLLWSSISYYQQRWFRNISNSPNIVKCPITHKYLFEIGQLYHYWSNFLPVVQLLNNIFSLNHVRGIVPLLICFFELWAAVPLSVDPLQVLSLENSDRFIYSQIKKKNKKIRGQRAVRSWSAYQYHRRNKILLARMCTRLVISSSVLLLLFFFFFLGGGGEI